MSRREFIVILLAAIVLTIAVPLFVQVFKPGQAGPEPLPGVPFSTAPRTDENGNTPNSIPVQEARPTVISGRVTTLNSEAPLPANIEWHIERSNGGDITESTPQQLQADMQGNFMIVFPPVNHASRFLIWVKARYGDFEPENFLGGWQDSGTEVDLGVIHMRPFGKVKVTWPRQAEVNLGGEFVAFRSIPGNPNDQVEHRIARLNEAGEATSRLSYGRWVMWLVIPDEPRITKTLIPWETHFDVSQPVQTIALAKLCEEGNCKITVLVEDQDGNGLNQSVELEHVGPGRPTVIVGRDARSVVVSNLPAGLYEARTRRELAESARRVYLADGQEAQIRLVHRLEPRLDLVILRRGTPVVGANVALPFVEEQITDSNGRVVIQCNPTSARLNIRLPATGSNQDIIVTREIHGWGDHSKRVIELEPVGSVSLLVGTAFCSGNQRDKPVLTDEGEYHVHLRALDPRCEVNEYRWATQRHGFRFIGLPRGKYLLELSAMKSGERNLAVFGPWSKVIDLNDPAKQDFVLSDVIPTFSFDVAVDWVGTGLDSVDSCTAWSSESDAEWNKRTRWMLFNSSDTLQVRNLPAGRWNVKVNGSSDFGPETRWGELTIDEMGNVGELRLTASAASDTRFCVGMNGINFEADSNTVAQVPTDGLLVLYALGGVPQRMWLAGPRLRILVQDLKPGYYWFGFNSTNCSWHSDLIRVESGLHRWGYHRDTQNVVNLTLTLSGLSLEDARGAFLENADGYQPTCRLMQVNRQTTLFANDIPSQPTMFLCLGDGRRISLDLGERPQSAVSRHYTLDLKKR